MGSVCAAVKPLAIMLCADRVPIKTRIRRCADPSGLSRSPDRPCLLLHYVVVSSPFVQSFSFQIGSGFTPLVALAFNATSIALRYRGAGAVHSIKSSHQLQAQSIVLGDRARRWWIMVPSRRSGWRKRSVAVFPRLSFARSTNSLLDDILFDRRPRCGAGRQRKLGNTRQLNYVADPDGMTE
jgi:hypothetical protein